MADTFEQTTLRVPLLDLVVDHLMKGKITCPHTHQVGCELVALLSAYREEDRRLFPEVYLLAPDEGDLLPVLAPGSRRCRLERQISRVTRSRAHGELRGPLSGTAPRSLSTGGRCTYSEAANGLRTVCFARRLSHTR
jgi:hypothetical protein